MLIAAGSASFAADIPAPVIKAPPAAVVALNWAGFYLGGNVGRSWGRARNELELGPFSLPWTDNLNGWVGGAQAGYNWQFGKLVFGWEADLQATGQKANRSGGQSGIASATVDVPISGSTIPVTFTSPYSYAYRYEEKLPWFGTVRGRIGIAEDRVLLYGTGGFAYAQVKAKFAATASAGPVSVDVVGIDFGFLLGFLPSSVPNTIDASSDHNLSRTKTGWTVGGGAEVAIADNWSAKFEYIYIDLGTLLETWQITAGPVTQTISFRSRITDSIFRVGLNYRFLPIL